MAHRPTGPALQLYRLMALVNRRGSQESLGFMHASGLTMPQIVVLHVVSHGERTMSELAGKLRMSAPATSQLVDRLVEGGLVSRAESATDRRVRTISLRPAGERFLEELNALRLRELEHALTALHTDVRGRLDAAVAEAVRELELAFAREAPSTSPPARGARERPRTRTRRES